MAILSFGQTPLAISPVSTDSTQKEKKASITYVAELGGIAATSGRTPFWLRANRYGTVPTTSPAALLRAGIFGRFGEDKKRGKVSGGFGFEAVGNLGSQTRLIVPEAYGRIGVGHVEFYAGRRKEVHGLVDTLLSSGSYSWSGNAVPITKVQIGTRGYAPLHFTGDLIAINTFFAHGWFQNEDSVQHSFLHQKAFYVKIGKSGGIINVFGGLVHNVQWGGSSKYLPYTTKNGKLPSSFEDYINVLLVRQPKDNGTNSYTSFDLANRVGNHLGSMDLAIDLNLKKIKIFSYYQHPFEDKSGFALRNMPDGLYGLSIENKTKYRTSAFQFKRFVIEYLYTLNQSGPGHPNSFVKYDGGDDYFNNRQYIDGWTSDKQVIGTPFITRWPDTKMKWVNVPKERVFMISNNKVKVFYFSSSGEFKSGQLLQMKISYSNNFGANAKLPAQVNQFSGLISYSSQINKYKNTFYGIELAIDRGNLLYNSIGGVLKIKQIW